MSLPLASRYSAADARGSGGKSISTEVRYELCALIKPTKRKFEYIHSAV